MFLREAGFQIRRDFQYDSAFISTPLWTLSSVSYQVATEKKARQVQRAKKTTRIFKSLTYIACSVQSQSQGKADDSSLKLEPLSPLLNPRLPQSDEESWRLPFVGPWFLLGVEPPNLFTLQNDSLTHRK